MSTTPPLVSSPRDVSPPPAVLAQSSAQLISKLARERLKPHAESTATSLASPLSADPLEIYYAKLDEAIESFKEGKVVEARQLFRETLNELPRTDDLQHNYARAAGWINLAATFELGNPARNETALKAEPFINEMYDNLGKAPTKEDAHHLRVLLNELSQLLTDKTSFPYLSLMGKIETLKAKYEEALPVSPRVSKDPVEGSWKTARIFFAFAFASLVIAVSAFALYRRFVTKID